MRQEDYKGFSFCRDFEKDYEINPKVVDIDPDYKPDEKDPSLALLQIIYAIDERTKCPSGDLTYYVNPKANPEIKKFILDNLMMDVSGAAKPAVPDGLSDDDIFALSRKDGESLSDYVNRMNSEVEKTKWLNEEYQKSIVSSSKVSESDSE